MPPSQTPQKALRHSQAPRAPAQAPSHTPGVETALGLPAQDTPATQTPAPHTSALGNSELCGAGPLAELGRGAALLHSAGVHTPGPGQVSNTFMRSLLRHSQAQAEGLDTDAAMSGARRSNGRPLPAAVQARMESMLGHDFTGVRIHTDFSAGQAAQELNALAFTLGRALYFAPGAFQPDSTPGLELLAHELVHVVQNDEGRLPAAPTSGTEVSSPSDPHEREAVRVSREVSALGAGALGAGALGVQAPAVEAAAVETAAVEAPSPSGAGAGLLSRYDPDGHNKAMTQGLDGLLDEDLMKQAEWGNLAQDMSQAPSVVGVLYEAWQGFTELATEEPDKAYKALQSVGSKLVLLASTSAGKALAIGAAVLTAIETLCGGSVVYGAYQPQSHLDRKDPTTEAPIDSQTALNNGTQYILDTLCEAMLKGDTPEGAELLGRASHTVEDFFAHSNFVERAGSVLKGQAPDTAATWGGEGLELVTYTDADQDYSMWNKVVQTLESISAFQLKLKQTKPGSTPDTEALTRLNELLTLLKQAADQALPLARAKAEAAMSQVPVTSASMSHTHGSKDDSTPTDKGGNADPEAQAQHDRSIDYAARAVRAIIGEVPRTWWPCATEGVQELSGLAPSTFGIPGDGALLLAKKVQRSDTELKNLGNLETSFRSQFPAYIGQYLRDASADHPLLGGPIPKAPEPPAQFLFLPEVRRRAKENQS